MDNYIPTKWIGGQTIATADKMNNIENGITESHSRLNIVDKELNTKENELKKNNRLIDYGFSATPWQFSYDGGTHPSRPDQITEQLEKMKHLGFDGIVIMATLIKDDNGNIDFDIPFENFLWFATETIRLGMTVRAVKIHMKNEYFTTIPDIENKYRTKVMQLANATKDYNIPYFVLFNEAVGYLYTSSQTVINYVTSLTQEVRSLGFKVGISGLSLKKLIEEYVWLKDCQDVMLPFSYARVSYKGKETTYEDSLFAYKQHVKDFIRYKNLINKPIIISETGILPYWNAFGNPVYYDWNKYESADNSGEIQKIFFYGLFNTPDFNKAIDECWVWFPDNMGDGNAYENCSKFIKHYTQGGL